MLAGFGEGEPAIEREVLSPMGKTLEYQGYTIQSSPQHLADGEKWQLRIFVSVDDQRGVKAREFLADAVCDGAGGRYPRDCLWPTPD